MQRMPERFGMKIHSSGIREVLSVTKIAHHLDYDDTGRASTTD